MKKMLSFFTGLLIGLGGFAQLKTTSICPTFTVDLLDGKVNDVKPTYSVIQIKERLPCFTNTEAEGSTTKCGAGVFFKDRDISFYTDRDYVEIGPKFKGKLSIPIMGAARTSLFKWLGHPKIKDVNWDAFTTSYGILICYYSKANKVTKIQFSTQGTESIKLCE
ncbi:MAG: hypothetical protein H7Y42_13330 [Chitinophagaceae bacterium]|nr:hypothetical protein [Chitinophagaceae bacterium]